MYMYIYMYMLLTSFIGIDDEVSELSVMEDCGQETLTGKHTHP